jgi:hypothetical protein
MLTSMQGLVAFSIQLWVEGRHPYAKEVRGIYNFNFECIQNEHSIAFPLHMLLNRQVDGAGIVVNR